MNTTPTHEPNLTPYQRALVREDLSTRFRTLRESHRRKRSRLAIARERTNRWNPEFEKNARFARKAFLFWLITWIGYAGAAILNLVLVQEIVPDFAGMVAALLGIDDGAASRFFASFLLTFFLFVILAMVKWASNTEEDRAELQQMDKLVLAKRTRRRIRRKRSLAIGYLALLAGAYLLLYRYIAYGPDSSDLQSVLDTLGETTATRFEGGRLPVGTGIDSQSEIDAVDATTTANTFLIYYAFEWILHALFLFHGAPLWFEPGFDKATARRRRDGERFQALDGQYEQRCLDLLELVTLRQPDDGFNEHRKCLQAKMPAKEWREILLVSTKENGCSHREGRRNEAKYPTVVEIDG